MRIDFWFGIAFLTSAFFGCAVHAQSAIEERSFAVGYRVEHLPVWKINSEKEREFDPSILISAIRNQVAPKSWKKLTTNIISYPEKTTLVVIQTQKNHQEVRLLLMRMKAFSSDKDLQQINRDIETGKAKNQRILLYLGDPDSDETRQVFNAFHTNEDLKILMSNFLLKCANRQYLWRPQTSLAGRKLGTQDEFVIIDWDKREVAHSTLKSLSNDEGLDLEAFTKFLESNKPSLKDAKTEFDNAIRTAAASKKHVLVQMSGPNCYPCELLKKYLDDNQKILSKDFVYLKLDRRMHQAEAIRNSLGIQTIRIPWMAIVDSDKKVLQTSVSKNGNIAFPRGPQAIEHFRKMISSTSNRITESKLDELIQSLTDETTNDLNN